MKSTQILFLSTSEVVFHHLPYLAGLSSLSVLARSVHCRFRGEEQSLLEVGDANSVVLDCEVFPKQDKTVCLHGILIYKIWFAVPRSLGCDRQEQHQQSEVYQTCQRWARPPTQGTPGWSPPSATPTTGGWRWMICRRRILVFMSAILLWDCKLWLGLEVRIFYTVNKDRDKVWTVMNV